MTDSETTLNDELPPAQGEPAVVETIPEIDWYLRSLVEIVNKSQMEVGITLVVSGLIVTGTMISGKTYFEKFASDISGAMEKAFGPSGIDAIRESFAAPSKMYGHSSEVPVTPPGFIHLKDARFFISPNVGIPNSGSLWRGRLSQVSGFTLGEYKVS